jgi:hypothetical protein
MAVLIKGKVQLRIHWHFDICVLTLRFGNVETLKRRYPIYKCCCLSLNKVDIAASIYEDLIKCVRLLCDLLITDVVKKMLFALRSGTFSRDIMPAFVATLRAVVKANFSTEVVRTLATFVTSFSQKCTTFVAFLILAKARPISKPAASPVKRTFSLGDDDTPRAVRKTSGARDTGCYEVVVLEMLVDVLLSPERRFINKFATTITSKVYL